LGWTWGPSILLFNGQRGYFSGLKLRMIGAVLLLPKYRVTIKEIDIFNVVLKRNY
jgi:hypothetical protein